VIFFYFAHSRVAQHNSFATHKQSIPHSRQTTTYKHNILDVFGRRWDLLLNTGFLQSNTRFRLLIPNSIKKVIYISWYAVTPSNIDTRMINLRSIWLQMSAVVVMSWEKSRTWNYELMSYWISRNGGTSTGLFTQHYSQIAADWEVNMHYIKHVYRNATFILKQ